MSAVLDRIEREAESVWPALGHPRVRSIYFGGGTPSALAPDLLDAFLPRFKRAIGFSETDRVEWSFEANPESTSEELLAVLGAHGINRLSIGVQSFQNHLLRFLGRRADRSTSLRAFDVALRHRDRIPHLSLDLMTGVPGQTAADVHEDVKTAIEQMPDHISLYSLTVEERTPLAQAVGIRPHLLPGAVLGESLWLTARELLRDEDFAWYEISNFAHAGGESAHNRSYWTLEPYIGFGPGAVSTVPAASCPSTEEPTRIQAIRTRNPGLFLYKPGRTPFGWDDPGREIEKISPRDFLLEHFITGLRTVEGVSLSRIRSIFGDRAIDALKPVLREWSTNGYLDEKLMAGSARVAMVPEERLRLDRHLVTLVGELDQFESMDSIVWPASADL